MWEIAFTIAWIKKNNQLTKGFFIHFPSHLTLYFLTVRTGVIMLQEFNIQSICVYAPHFAFVLVTDLRGRGCACSACSRSPSMVRITSLSSWAVPSRGPPPETSSSAQYPPSFSFSSCFPCALLAAVSRSSSAPFSSLHGCADSGRGWPL